MKTLVLGANGATGKHLVAQLLHLGIKVKAVVRDKKKIDTDILQHTNLEVVVTSIDSLTVSDFVKLLKDCDKVVSCLGHNVSLSGIFGQPRKLVTDTLIKIHLASLNTKPSSPLRLILMSSNGVRAHSLNEKVSLIHKFTIFLLRYLIPPHKDNELAVEYLCENVLTGNGHMSWVAVRPDNLVNSDVVKNYSLATSPVRDALFNTGKVGRIDVAHFMATLITNESQWKHWEYAYPVVYGDE